MSFPGIFVSLVGIGAGALLFVAYHLLKRPEANTYTNKPPSYEEPPSTSQGIYNNSDSANTRRRKTDTSEKCIICLDGFFDANYQFTNCCHKFHINCLNSWRKYSPYCPVCRERLQL